jgi:hypothetical protein
MVGVAMVAGVYAMVVVVEWRGGGGREGGSDSGGDGE